MIVGSVYRVTYRDPDSVDLIGLVGRVTAANQGSFVLISGDQGHWLQEEWVVEAVLSE